MTFPMRLLLAALYDIGSKDIYSKAPEHASKVETMRQLLDLVARALELKRGSIDATMVSEIMAKAKEKGATE